MIFKDNAAQRNAINDLHITLDRQLQGKLVNPLFFLCLHSRTDGNYVLFTALYACVSTLIETVYVNDVIAIVIITWTAEKH